ncbi:ABC transporter ATP-binding protein [Microcella daejeonensis]|uniref:ABC transporter ATP-binding protein n=1 Tax=Microcella daejeonensis TaxID=2994971 RepID=UPI00226EFF97|nr:ABC transporter ATP-binding protein [Microcella daejeonensis]WAB84028.1 ABC transporter ATP-binding protein [Microcella daejeonensis]
MNETPVVVQVHDLSKRFVIRREKSLKERLVNFGRSAKHKEDFYALRNVTIDIRQGTTVGLIGPNGSGKSTLLKAIGGIIQPTSGDVRHRGRIAALLELGAGFHPDLTGRENVYLNASIMGLSRTETDSYFDDIVEFSGIAPFIDTQVKFYSSGMYVRLAFAVAVHVDPDILIVDEVLAVGDEPFQRKCMERIKAFQRAGKTIILVTHSMGQVGEICDRAIVLRKGEVRFDGPPAEAINQLRDDFEEAADEQAADAADEGHELTIESATIESATDDGAGDISSGRGLDFVVKIAAPGEVRDVIVGMGIETPLGQIVFGTNTEYARTAIPLVDGSATVRFSLRDMRLGEGRYILHASVGAGERTEMSRMHSADTFTVGRMPDQIGVAGADIRIVVDA